MDISLDSNGDFALTSFNDNYELVEEKDELYVLLRRAVQTPLSFLGRTIIDDKGINIVDDNFGNSIYGELSEGITINFITRVKQHIVNAIDSLKLDVGVTDVHISLIDELNSSVNISIYFNDSKIINLNVPL